MGSRERILTRIRRAHGRGGDVPPEAERDLVRRYLSSHPRGPVREPGLDVLAHFRERAAASASTLDAVASEREVPAAVAQYLSARGIPGRGCVWPSLAALDWAGAGLALEARFASGEDPVGVTGVFCAIAETGTLCVLSGAQSPASASLVPETHVAVVPAGRIVACMEDAWDLLRAEFGSLPRAVNYISGPSRTADIEQTVVLGAHGPARVHIVVVG